MILFRYHSFVVLAVSLLLLIGCSGGDGISGTGAKTISGTAAEGKAIANKEVTVKDRMGGKRSAMTGADGKFSIDVTDMTPPFILNVNTEKGKRLFTVTPRAGVANLHPFSDVIARNWFKSHDREIENEFDSDDEINNPPEESQLNAIKNALKNLLIIAFEEFGIASEFDLVHSGFDVGEAGFDQLLDNIKIVIKENKITIKLTDPNTGFFAIIILGFDLSDDLTQDNIAPSQPAGLAVFPASSTSIVLIWNSSIDNIGVKGYNVYREGNTGDIPTTPYPHYVDTGLSADTEYCYTVDAEDGAGNRSIQSMQVCASTPAESMPDTPPVPANLTVSAIGSSAMNIQWDEVQDDGFIAYDIVRSGAGEVDVDVATVVSPYFNDFELLPETEYCYKIQAIKIVDSTTALESGFTQAVCQSTESENPTDTVPPVSTASPVGGEYATAQSVTLSCDDGGGLGCAVIHYTVDGTDPTTNSPVYDDLQPIAIASNTTLKYFAIDNAGNVESPYKFEVYVINTSAKPLPGAPIVSSTTPTNDPTPAWSWSSGGGGDGTYRYKLDDANLDIGATETVQTTFTPASDLAEGTHTLYVQESSSGGDWSVSGSFEVLVDITPPATVATPAGGSYPDTVNVELECDDGTGSGCDATYYTTEANAPLSSYLTYVIGSPVEISADSTLYFYSVDNVANQEVIASETYTIDPDVLQTISLSPASASVYVDETLQLTATGTYASSSTLDLTNAVTWSSSDITVATVDSVGIVTAVSVGTAEITAVHNGTGITSSTPTTITVPSLQSIKVAPIDITVGVGAVRHFAAYGVYDDGSRRDMTDLVDWNSTEISVASIDNVAGSKGIVTAEGIGTTTITAMDPQSSYNDSVKFNVDIRPLPYFYDDFESGLAKWSVSGSDWGIISTADAVSPTHSVTDSPGGNILPNENASLTLRNTIDLSSSSSPVLSFWMKLHNGDCTSGYDYAYLEISQDGGINWETPTLTYNCVNYASWSQVVVDLSGYKTNPIKVRFRLRADGDDRVSDGWYIDNVEIKEQDNTVTTTFPFFDDFENGLSNWLVSGSDWDIVSTDSVLPGSSSVTESPGDNILPNANASLTLLDPIDLSSSSSPVLSFWMKLYNGDCTSGYDYAYLEISQDGGINWESPALTYNCVNYGSWSQVVVDLGGYKTNPIKVRFRLRADGDDRVGDGWYIDNVEIKEQDTATTVFPFFDDFESGLSNWLVSGSDWAIVSTDSVLPGSSSVTESPGDNILPNANASLTLLHPINLSSSSSPVLSFWMKLYNGDCTSGYDYAYLEISQDGGINWESPALTYNCVNYGSWSQVVVDLGGYKTNPIKVRFRLRADGDDRVGDGWYIDNVEIKEQDTATTVFPFFDDFESGLSNWLVSGSDWAIVSTDSVLPGSNSVTESPNGNFLQNANSSLTLLNLINLASTNTPMLHFWEKIDLPDATSGYDYAYVEISEDGGISWDTPALTYNYVTYSTWTEVSLGLSNYKTVPIKIRFRLRADGDGRVGDGWSIDDVSIYDAAP